MRFVLILTLMGCSATQDASQTVTETGTPTTSATTTPCVFTRPDAEVLTLTTQDGVSLEADRYAGLPGEPGFVLLHMIPPSNTRADWPLSFIDKLSCHGWSVVAVDRRGAGGSSGEPADSYEGPGGAWDVQAAVEALAEIGAEGMVAIGASNGSTSALDYKVLAEQEGLAPLVAVGFLSGGSYTENQNSVASLGALPTLFAYPEDEASWNESQQSLDPGSWVFNSYAQGGHGTRLFDNVPRVKNDIETFFVEVLSSL